VEYSEEAVKAAVENAAVNNVSNAEFICEDVTHFATQGALSDIAPDIIILDPPREGVHPKALEKIAALRAGVIIYISCKTSSLMRDLEMLINCGYSADNMFMVDMFPWCAHMEVVVRLLIS
jgi:tRNA/tmRNA/rRNA uracil-C5-methylase (TrmA/RlmC/RlmD family)